MIAECVQPWQVDDERTKVQPVREHARQGGFPADRISEIKAVIDQTTAEQRSACCTVDCVTRDR
jgi:hypothetical protein